MRRRTSVTDCGASHPLAVHGNTLGVVWMISRAQNISASNGENATTIAERAIHPRTTDPSTSFSRSHGSKDVLSGEMRISPDAY